MAGAAVGRGGGGRGRAAGKPAGGGGGRGRGRGARGGAVSRLVRHGRRLRRGAGRALRPADGGPDLRLRARLGRARAAGGGGARIRRAGVAGADAEVTWRTGGVSRRVEPSATACITRRLTPP